MKKTIKISDVIKILEDFKERLGDLPVYLQKSKEGNEFGTLNKDKCFYWTELLDKNKNYKRLLTIQPFEERLKLNELVK